MDPPKSICIHQEGLCNQFLSTQSLQGQLEHSSIEQLYPVSRHIYYTSFSLFIILLITPKGWTLRGAEARDARYIKMIDMDVIKLG